MSLSHDECVDNLVRRLAKKPFSLLGKEIDFKGPGGKVVYKADVVRITSRGKLQFVTAYEVKTGVNGRRTAIVQARAFYGSIMFSHNTVPNFVYINPTTEQVQRWSPTRVHTDLAHECDDARERSVSIYDVIDNSMEGRDFGDENDTPLFI